MTESSESGKPKKRKNRIVPGHRFRVLASTAGSFSEQLEEDIITCPGQIGERELLCSWNEYLCNHWQELLAKFEGKYVAVWENEVIDSDEDLGRLAGRVYSRVGYRPVFMPYISEKEQVYEFLGHI